MRSGIPSTRVTWSDNIQRMLNSTRKNLVGIEKGPTKYCNSCFFHNSGAEVQTSRTVIQDQIYTHPEQDSVVIMKSKRPLQEELQSQQLVHEIDDKMERKNAIIAGELDHIKEVIKLLQRQMFHVDNKICDTFEEMQKQIANLGEVLKERDAAQALTPAIEEAIDKKLDEKFNRFNEKYLEEVQILDDRTNESAKKVLEDRRETQKLKLSFEELLTEKELAIKEYAANLIRKEMKNMESKLEATEAQINNVDKRVTEKITEVVQELDEVKINHDNNYIKESINEVKSNIDKINENIKTLNKKNKTMEHNLNEQMEALKNSQERSNNKIELKTQTLILEKDSETAELKKSVGTVLKKMEEIESRVIDEDQKIQDLDSQILKLKHINLNEQATTEYAKTSSNEIKLNEKVLKLEEAINEFNTTTDNLSVMKEEIKELKRDKEELNDRLEKLAEEFKDSYNTQEQKLNEQLRRVKTIDIEIEQLKGTLSKGSTNRMETTDRDELSSRNRMYKNVEENADQPIQDNIRHISKKEPEIINEEDNKEVKDNLGKALVEYEDQSEEYYKAKDKEEKKDVDLNYLLLEGNHLEDEEKLADKYTNEINGKESVSSQAEDKTSQTEPIKLINEKTADNLARGLNIIPEDESNLEIVLQQTAGEQSKDAKEEYAEAISSAEYNQSNEDLEVEYFLENLADANESLQHDDIPVDNTNNRKDEDS